MFLILKPMKFVIRKEFKDLIPPSSDDELDGLEKRILYEGCRDPLVLWFDEEEGEHFLIDGHQRYEIIQRLGLKHYQTKVIKLPEDMEPEEWIVENQFSRRNLDTCYLIWFSIL
jgi:ParB-like chromosome segregation protein Spo0J